MESLTKIWSLNTVPPECEDNFDIDMDLVTFHDSVKESAMLYVPNNAINAYMKAPVWKDFRNLTDEGLGFELIPDAKYGDEEIDLKQFEPEGTDVAYRSYDKNVIRINGARMKIVGAGSATISAYTPAGEDSEEVLHSIRTFKVNKADLTLTVADIVMEQGSEVPEFTYLAHGLKYDDTVDDIQQLPQPIHNVDANSPVGEYEVTFAEGWDRNYNITTVPARIIVKEKSGIEGIFGDMDDADVEVYDLSGLLVYSGKPSEAKLTPGVYIVQQGKLVRKVMLK